MALDILPRPTDASVRLSPVAHREYVSNVTAQGLVLRQRDRRRKHTAGIETTFQ